MPKGPLQPTCSCARREQIILINNEIAQKKIFFKEILKKTADFPFYFYHILLFSIKFTNGFYEPGGDW